MNVSRGDVVLAFYPFAAGVGGKRRPVLVVQNDNDNRRLTNTVVALITSTLDRAHEATHLLIELAASEGRQSGLLHDSVVSCNNLTTISETRIQKTIGRLSAGTMARIDLCLKVALELP
jgi:mRNA interferase MazF